MARIALDAMGGDHAPVQTVLGALDAAARGVDVVLVGDEEVLARELAEEWAAGDPGFPILVDSTVPPFEPYTGGVSYGRVRLLTREEFDLADTRGEFVMRAMSPPLP